MPGTGTMVASVPFEKKRSLLNEALFNGGCAILSAATKDAIFYGLDSYKVMKQAGQRTNLYALFRGTVPIAVIGSGFSFGAFFVFYTPIRNTIKEHVGPENDSLAVLIASSISAVPSSLVGVPADVIKKQLVLSQQGTNINNKTITRVVTNIWRNYGMKGFALGWNVNVFRDVPYASLKMSLYEGMSRLYLTMFRTNRPSTSSSNNQAAPRLQGNESAMMGFSSGVVAAFIACPIDCVNTRIKSGEFRHTGMVQAYKEIWRKDGVKAFFRGALPRCTILAVGSTVFWYIQTSLVNSFS